MRNVLRTRGLTCCCLTIATLLVAARPAFSQTEPERLSPLGSKADATASAATVPLPEFSKLFSDIVGDFRHLPSRDTAVLLGIGAGAAVAGHRADVSSSRALSSSNGLHEALESGQTIGGMPFQLGVAVAAYAIGRQAGSSRATKVGAELIRAQVLSEATTYAIKAVANRTRPDGTARSFPSGHSSSAFASATVLQRNFGWKIGIPAYAVATYVAASRIQMERHYLSDVIFGAAMGIAAGRTVTVGRGSARFAMAPLVVPGGGAIGFDWAGNR